jgi:predicted dehydrogenase
MHSNRLDLSKKEHCMTLSINRRQFVQSVSSAALSGAVFSGRSILAEPAPAHAANDRVQIGIIGPGSRGQELIRQLLHVPGVEIAAVCDIYDPRFQQVDRLVGKTVPYTKDYEELLARRGLDAIVIASPLPRHAEHVIAATRTGLPIYGEKSMGFTVADTQDILKAVVESKVIYQVGHQYRYAPWIIESVARIKRGEIGDVTHVYAYWHRNNDWRRPVPVPDPGGKLEHLINWRLYRESSGGLVTELGSHHIEIANWIFEEQPAAVLGTSSICRYHDGRTVGDNVQAIFTYSAGRRLVFSSITDNAKNANEVWVYGTKGSVQMTIEDATFFFEPTASKPIQAADYTAKKGITTGASYSPQGEMPYRGNGELVKTEGAYEDPTLTALRSFVDSVRHKTQPIADARVGFGSAIACSVAHDAVFEETRTAIPGPSI